MSAEPISRESRSPGARLVVAAGILSLLPYLLYHQKFAQLFWFGDEFDLLDQIDKTGFWHWTWGTFAENFVPVFKVLWGGAAVGLGGSYAVMILIGMLLHAANTVLLGKLMRACDLPLSATLFAQVVFGLAPSNVETLGWSVQWSATLSVTFMLLALLSFARKPLGYAPSLWGFASALSFSRGVLTGILLALAAIAAGTLERPSVVRRIGVALLYVLPAFFVAYVISVASQGNHKHLAGHGADAFVFGAWCFGMNPFYLLFKVASWGPRTVAALATLKLALFAWVLVKSRGNARLLFAVLFAFELGNVTLLGIGRYHTGLMAATSSRYQYAAFLTTMPPLGYWLSRCLKAVPAPHVVQKLVVAVLLVAVSVSLCRSWSNEIGWFSDQRGVDSRRILFTEASPPEFSVPGIPFMPMGRAKELIRKYHLH